MIDPIRDWTTKAGLRAIILMHPSMGHLCGYVEVRAKHPLFGKHYGEHCNVLVDRLSTVLKGPIGNRGAVALFIHSSTRIASPDVVFDVHGSITYSGTLSRCSQVRRKGWWFGFDLSHYGDENRCQDESYVESECESLARQLAEVQQETGS